MKQIQKRLLIRLNAEIRYNNNGRHICWFVQSRDEKSIGEFLKHGYERVVLDHRLATDLNTLPLEKALGYFHKLKDEKGQEETIELVEVTTTDIFETKFFDEEAEQEFLRKVAISKLSEAEIHALGVENLAVYGKLKYHNVGDENE